MDHIDTPGSDKPPFRGFRVSKGTSREQRLTALRRMLTSKEEADVETEEDQNHDG